MQQKSQLWMLRSTHQGVEMGTGPEGHYYSKGEDTGEWLEQGKTPRNQAIIPDRSQKDLSILKVWMMFQGDNFLPTEGTICNLSGETEPCAMSPPFSIEQLEKGCDVMWLWWFDTWIQTIIILTNWDRLSKCHHLQAKVLNCLRAKPSISSYGSDCVLF